MKESKKSRNKRKAKKNPAYSAFIRNKWDGKEPYVEFSKREFRLWNNMPPEFKNPFRKRVS